MSTNDTAKDEWMRRDRRKGRELVEAWGDLFGSVPWQLFITLTFDPHKVFPVNALLADKEAFWWCCQVSRVARLPIGWLYVVERGRGGRWHAHVLLVGLPNGLGPSPEAMWQQRNGLAHVTAVDHSRGAVLYTTKEAALTGEVSFSDTMARYRASSCALSRIELFPSGNTAKAGTDARASRCNARPAAGTATETSTL